MARPRHTNLVTSDGRLSRVERQAQEIENRLARQSEEIRKLARLSDDELIAQTPANTSLSRPLPQMEISRRLKDAVEALTAELVMFRESSMPRPGTQTRRPGSWPGSRG